MLRQKYLCTTKDQTFTGFLYMYLESEALTVMEIFKYDGKYQTSPLFVYMFLESEVQTVMEIFQNMRAL